MAEELPDSERRGVVRRQFHAREFGNPLRHRIFERQLALIAQLENGERGETLRHRGDAKHRAGRDGRIRGAIPHAGRFDVREPAIDHDTPHHAGNLFVGGVMAKDLVDFRQRGFELPESFGIGKARRRVGIARKERGRGQESAEGDESHMRQDRTLLVCSDHEGFTRNSSGNA